MDCNNDHITSMNAGIQAGRDAAALIAAGLPYDTALASAAIAADKAGYTLSPWLYGWHIAMSDRHAIR